MLDVELQIERALSRRSTLENLTIRVGKIVRSMSFLNLPRLLSLATGHSFRPWCRHHCIARAPAPAVFISLDLWDPSTITEELVRF